MKFDSTIDVAIKLGVDPKQSNQMMGNAFADAFAKAKNK